MSTPPALPHLAALLRTGALADVAIALDASPPVPAHSAVLAAASGYFHAMFVGAGREMGSDGGDSPLASPRTVSLVGLPPPGVAAALDFAYSCGAVLPGEAVAADALRVADFLDMPALARAAAAVLMAGLTPATALAALGVASTCGDDAAGDLAGAALRVAHARFDECVASPALPALPFPALLAFLAGDAAAAASEGDVLAAAAAWLAADPVPRARHARALVDAVRLPPADLAAAPATQTLLDSLPPAAAAALRTALADAAATPRPRGAPLPPPAPAAAERACLSFLPLDGAWRPGPRAPAPLPFATAAPAAGSGRCYVVAGAATRTTALLLSREEGGAGAPSAAAAPALSPARAAAAGLRWRALPPPCTARIHAAAAALGDDLFVIGGRPGVGPELSSVELWCPAAARWAAAPSLAAPRTAASAAAVAGAVYVVGGQTGKTTHAGGEWFDAGAGGRWLPLGPRSTLATPRKYAAAVEWGGRLVLLGGTDGLRARLASVEALDPREGVWRPLPSLALPRSGAGAAVAAGGALVVAGGTPAGGDGAVESVELLAAGGGGWGAGGDGGWCVGAPLGAPRAGLALMAV